MCRLSVCCLTMFAVSSMEAQRPGVTTASRTSTPVTVSLTSSGAISVGAYEAGVNWVLTEMLRIAAYDPTLRRAILGDADRAFRLSSAAGASAGNINSVLTALSYCARPNSDTLRPDSSLFWKVWISVGIEQLFPAVNGNERLLRDLQDPGPFSRRFFKESAWQEVKDFRNHVAVYPECHVPVGFTLTQLDTVSYPVAGPVSAPVQRLATVFQVRSASETENEYRAGELGFFPLPNSISYRHSLGAIALLPELYTNSATPSTGALSARDSAVLWAIEAGSAVPPAFAPRWLCYVPPTGEPTGDHAMEQASLPATGKVCHRFTDGGVFDNNPLALGFDLAKHDARVSTNDSIWIMFSDPYRLRNQVGAPPAQSEDSTLGIGYLLQLGANGFLAARRYELQSLGRLINRIREDKEARLATSDPVPVVKISSRGTRLVGTQFNSFGAFLGRPFREYDFYTGVYDGLRVIGESFVCSPTRGDLNDCAKTVQLRLLRDNPLRLNPFTLTITRWFAEREHGAVFPTSDNFKPSSDESRRLRVLRAIFDILATPENSGEAPQCHEPGYLARDLCSSGFGVLLFQLRTISDVHLAILNAYANRVECHQPSDPERGRCFVDRAFVRLIDDPESFLDRLVEDLLLRAQNIEDHEERLRMLDVARYPYAKSDARVYHESHSDLIKVAQAAHREFSAATLRGLQKDPSSIPDRHVGAFEKVMHGLPYYVLLGEGLAGNRLPNGGYRVEPARATPFTVGWQPTWAIADDHPDNALMLPVELSYFRARHVPADPGQLSTRLGVAGGLGYALWRSTSVSPSVAVLLTNHLLKEQDPAWTNASSLRLIQDASVVFEKYLRVSYRWTPFSRSTDSGHREYALQAGVVNFNGLLYWLFR